MDDSSGDWLRAAIRFSLSTSSAVNPGNDVYQTTDAPIKEKDPGKDPRFRKLVQQVLYGRKVIATYNIALLVILAVFTVLHWGGKLQRARRWRRAAIRAWERQDAAGIRGGDTLKSGAEVQEVEDGSSSTAASSSSSTAGTATPPSDGQNDERKPLLSRRERPARKAYSILSSIRALLLYQPRNLPIVNRVLPANSVSLLVVAFIGLNVVYMLYGGPRDFMGIFVYADRIGLLFGANLPLLYLLAAKNQPIKLLTGRSYEALNIFHRRLGEMMCFMAVLHFLGMFTTWYFALRPTGFPLARFLLNRLVLPGIGAFVAYELLYFTSLGSFRHRFYELFLGLHIVLQVAALVFLWLHYPTSKPYVGASIGIFLVDRLLYRLYLKSANIRASLSILEDGETVLVSSNWDVSNRTITQALTSTTVQKGWKPTDHVFLTIPALSRTNILQAHPFTIASAAPGLYASNSSNLSETPARHAWLNFLIRAHDGFSKDLLRYARTHNTVSMRVDGPYGSTHALEMLEDTDRAVLVAGGSGIAVAFPLVWALLHPPHSPSDLESIAPSTSSRRQEVHLVWVVHSSSHVSWIPTEMLEELKAKGLHLHITPPTVEAGRPDLARLVSQCVGSKHNKAAVVVSGPDGMSRAVRNAAAELVRAGRDVDIAVEKFGW